jgi:phosphatidylserine/phosphatidylglycerophosphate/cardiolipin synthase-like enzyme
MRILKRLFLLCVNLHFTTIQTVWTGEQGTIQFVESIPVETNLGISETEQTLAIWLERISGAQESIDMEFFYVAQEPGKALDPIMVALKAAAARNVNIRILVDNKMAKIYPEILKELGDVENIGVSQIRYFNLKKGVQHAKYFIFDDRELFLGVRTWIGGQSGIFMNSGPESFIPEWQN